MVIQKNSYGNDVTFPVISVILKLWHWNKFVLRNIILSKTHLIFIKNLKAIDMKTKTNWRFNANKEEMSSNLGLHPSQLMVLFEDELKDIYWAEKELIKELPKMINNASSQELIEALENHLAQTQEQISRIEHVFEILGKKASAKKCEAMEGLIREGKGIMEECEEGPMCDAGIISAAQKIEHYEIATYGTLRQFAQTLRINNAAELLEQTLSEEKATDENLSRLAVTAINVEADLEESDEVI
jgi:ferritin-like metal-binding protein YciE